jgi:hypothetical protein
MWKMWKTQNIGYIYIQRDHMRFTKNRSSSHEGEGNDPRVNLDRQEADRTNQETIDIKQLLFSMSPQLIADELT